MSRKKLRGRPGPALTVGVPLALLTMAVVAGFRYWSSKIPEASLPAVQAAKQETPAGPVSVRVAADPWSGYSTFRSEPRLKAELAQHQIQIEYLDDEKYYDQNERMRALGAGEIDLALTTLDAFLQHGAKHRVDGHYPGVIVFGIDESAGGDAIFLAKGRSSFDQVKAGDKVCFAEGTPSEHLWDFASLMFEALDTEIGKDVGVVAEDCWKKLEQGKVQIGVLWQPFTALAEKAGYRKVFATGGQADDVIVDIAVANRAFAKRQPQALGQLVASYFKIVEGYQRDREAHARFITKDCGPDCAGDNALGSAVLSGIDFLTAEENLCLWFGHCGKPNKLVPRVAKTGKLLIAKGKLNAGLLPTAESIIDDRFLRELKGEREERAQLVAEVSGPETQLASAGLSVEEAAYEYVVPGAEDASKQAIGTLKLPRVYFREGSYQLDDNARSVIGAIADRLRSFPAMCVRVLGYTNSKGDPGANRKLSQLRALVITQELTRIDPVHFPQNRFLVKGMGAQAPVLSQGAEDAKASRRTEFTLFDCAGT